MTATIATASLSFLFVFFVPLHLPCKPLFVDGTDPKTVVKSLCNFANYGKRNKESLAELFVTLLIKLSSVEKLWSKGLCVSTCTGSWASKTWDSKVACISVEDFTDPSQNVARAVGQAEAKLIYKCIDISIRHIFSFMDRKIGGEVKDLLFGRDGVVPPNTPFTSSRGYVSNLVHPFAAAWPCSSSTISYQANQSGKVVAATGKTRKQVMHPVSAQEQAKRMRIAEDWRRRMHSGSLGAANGVIPSYSDPIIKSKKNTGERCMQEVKKELLGNPLLVEAEKEIHGHKS